MSRISLSLSLAGRWDADFVSFCSQMSCFLRDEEFDDPYNPAPAKANVRVQRKEAEGGDDRDGEECGRILSTAGVV